MFIHRIMLQMLKETYELYKNLGITVIGVEWNVEKKEPVSHREWSKSDLQLLPRHNALMIKTDGNYACLDFDLKNTDRKSIFNEWKKLVLNEWPDLYAKFYIEETRNKGYHVWFNYDKLEKKISLAESPKGAEVIALYAKGPLVYTFPTPGYTEIHSSMDEAGNLTEAEFKYLIQTSQGFNEYSPDYDPNLKAVNYPVGNESLLSQFDRLLPDDLFIKLLGEIDLVPIPDYRYHAKDKFAAYRRKGSTSKAISAKVYFNSKRVLIFSGSMNNFPNYHNRHDYTIWSLPPSFIIFYKLKRSWPAAIEYIKLISEACSMEIKTDVQVTDFPMHIFPESIRLSIHEVAEARSIPLTFLATTALWTVSSLAGTHYTSDFNGDAKNILFCLLVAPVSVGKTPAYKSICETPLKILQEKSDTNFNKSIIQYEEEKASTMESKQKFTKKRPKRFIPFAVDGTTEGYVVLCQDQKNGVGIYHDEAETIFNAGSFKTNNDSISFFTQAFGGGRYTQIRADREKERVVPNMNINLLMGTQPGRLMHVFPRDKIESGFASRFIMVESDYIPLNTEIDPFIKNKEMCEEWVDLLVSLYNKGELFNAGEISPVQIEMTKDAKDLYRKYYRENLVEANQRFLSKAEKYIIGTEAKMSNYFPRITQLLSIMHNPGFPVITTDIVQMAYDVYKFFAKSTIKIIGTLAEEIETGLPAPLELLYKSLPDSFSRKDAVELCVKLNMSENKFEISMRRKDFKALFRKTEKGIYTKI